MYIRSTQMYIHVQCCLVVHVYGSISELSTCKFLLTQALPTGTLQPCSYHSFTTVHVRVVCRECPFPLCLSMMCVDVYSRCSSHSLQCDENVE